MKKEDHEHEARFFDEVARECQTIFSPEVFAALFGGGVEHFKEVIRGLESIFLAYPGVFGSMMFDLMVKAYSLRTQIGQSTEVVVIPEVTGRHDN